MLRYLPYLIYTDTSSSQYLVEVGHPICSPHTHTGSKSRYCCCIEDMKKKLYVVLTLVFVLTFCVTCFSFRHVIRSPSIFSVRSSSVDPILDAVVIKDVTALKCEILKKAGLCVRGEIATEEEKLSLSEFICELEGSFEQENIPNIPEMSKGTWELVYSSSYLFRSSPFFMSARAVCKDGEEADRFNYFCKLHREALAFTSIGHVRQVVTDETLTSYFESNVAALPGLPVNIKGTIVSKADIQSSEGSSLKLLMNTVTIENSNIPVIKDLLQPLDSRALASILESNFPDYSNPIPEFRCYYVDSDMKICRDQDDNIFVYNRLDLD